MYPLPEGAMRTNGWSLSENALKSKAMFKELMGYAGRAGSATSCGIASRAACAW